MTIHGIHTIHPTILGTDRITGGFTDRSFGDTRIPETIHKLTVATDNVPVRFVRQVHGIRVIRENLSGSGQDTHADGLVATATHGAVGIGVRTADCVPILAVDPISDVFGAVHAGWKGTQGNIMAALLTVMEQSGARLDSIRIVFGPHIGKCCYAVSDDRIGEFRKTGIPDSIGWYGSANGTTTLALSAVLRWQAQSLGIPGNSIFDTGECTSCTYPMYYSYRRDSRQSFGEMTGFLYFRGDV